MAGIQSASKKDSMIKWILAGIPILFLASAPLHFVFEWSGRSPVSGVFSPVNESVWEHLKMVIWPVLIWWFAGYFLFHKRNNKTFVHYVYPCMISEVVCILFIVAFFYTYTGALGVESLVVDIASILVALFLGQYFGLRIYKYGKPGRLALLTSIVILCGIAAAFIFFTFAPPHLPLFLDKNTGLYGIGS